MRDSVPSASYSSVSNVLCQWNIPLIPTYRVYRLYDNGKSFGTATKTVRLNAVSAFQGVIIIIIIVIIITVIIESINTYNI